MCLVACFFYKNFLNFRLLAQTSPENTTSKNFTIDPQSRYKTLNILKNDTLKEMKDQVRHLIIDKPDIDMKIYRISNEAKRARRATVGIDPNDILKAKNLPVDTSKLDEFVVQTSNHHHHLMEYQRNHPILYSVPSSDALNNNNKNYNRQPRQHCDNNQSIDIQSGSRSPIEVVQFLPRNHSNTTVTTAATNIKQNNLPRHLDVQPRNDRLMSNMAKKNHHARNHFFHDEQQRSNCSTSSLSSISSHQSRHDWPSSLNHRNNDGGDDDDQISSHELKVNNNRSKYHKHSDRHHHHHHDESAGYDKENCPIPNFKQMFLLDDYVDDDDDDDGNPECSTRNYPKSKSKSTSSVKNRINSISQPQSMFGQLIDSRRSLHDFEKSLSRKPVKKSSDIMEKAQFLEQKFEEHNRSYVPNLNRVGRIEEDDWNVKIWNDSNLFGNCCSFSPSIN